MLLADVKAWRYQLQNVDVAALAASSAGMLVIDRAKNDEAEFSPIEIARMQATPAGGRRLLLCYWSIGEAEDYRPYWRPEWKRSRPDFLGDENPEWKGNYAVRFWLDSWQAIVFKDLAKIMSQGFDGVYLDKVDQFEDLGHATQMMALVGRIARVARETKPDFLVVPQNGDVLLASTANGYAYRHAISGIAREDLFFGEDGDGQPNDPASTREAIGHLRMLRSEGKPVFVVEYSPAPSTIMPQLSDLGFVGLLAHRDLDR